MRIRKVASYYYTSRYHDSVCYCKMVKEWTQTKNLVCDFPSTSRDGYCDFHQFSKSNTIMKPPKCEVRGCDRSFCGKVLRTVNPNGKKVDHIYCRLHFGRARKGEDMFKKFGSRPKRKNVVNVTPYVEEGDLRGIGI